MHGLCRRAGQVARNRAVDCTQLSAAAPRILVAEDDATLRALLTDVLHQEFGAVVEAVPDGLAAVTAVSAGAYDLLVLDLLMPKVDGFDVLRWLANRPPDARIPAVVCTASTPEHREEASRLGAVECVAKPFDLDDFTATVRRVLTAPTG